ncbi:MAG: hypothetical protein JAY95_04295, partial [Candidatus Thiodiazotropha taylori]|nr:hypothetical protein [Candidatus Thiodiazotropha taylori]
MSDIFPGRLKSNRILLGIALIPPGIGLSSAAETLAPIEVISTTPLHGVSIERTRLPMHTEVATDED